MRKRILSLLLALIMCLSLAAPALAVPTGYSDVPERHWSAQSVRRATQLGIFNGVGGGKFGRGQPITRAAFVTAMVRLFDWEAVTPAKATFTDVAKGRWYYTAVETACANGAIPTAGKTFRPTENITREEMASMLVRGLGYASLAGTVGAGSSPFTDVTTNRGFIALAYDLGIVSGVGNNKFAPDNTATREQAAVMLVRIYDKLHGETKHLTEVGGCTPLRIATPEAVSGQELPTTPLEPVVDLYTGLRKLKSGGADMSKVVLCLTAGGVRTLTSGGRILESDTVTAEEVAEILAGKGVRTYYSDRYESAYCIYQPNGYQSATLWYQSDESLAAKLQLARLFGVTKYILE